MTSVELNAAHMAGEGFQYHHLLSDFTALENLMLPMLGAAQIGERDMAARANLLLESVGLAAWRDHLATDMSGGQQQRVAVARALVMNPPLLLAAEPTGNLDSKSASGVFDLLRAVNRDNGMAILFVTHNAALAARCDRTINVVDGVLASM
jgi:lipoprotein-releasing system ATP-binding protein